MFKYIFSSPYIFVSTEVEVKQEMLSQRCHQPFFQAVECAWGGPAGFKGVVMGRAPVMRNLTLENLLGLQ